MKNSLKLFIPTTLALLTMPVQAEKLAELSVGKIEVSSADTEFVQFAYGFELESYPVALQVRVGTALDDIEKETNLGLGGGLAAAQGLTSTLNEKISDLKYLSLLASADYSLSDSVSLYGLAGYSQVKADFETTGRINGVTVVDASLGDVDGGSFSYGAGLRFNLSESFSIKAEYFALSSDITTTNIGLAWHF